MNLTVKNPSSNHFSNVLDVDTLNQFARVIDKNGNGRLDAGDEIYGQRPVCENKVRHGYGKDAETECLAQHEDPVDVVVTAEDLASERGLIDLLRRTTGRSFIFYTRSGTDQENHNYEFVDYDRVYMSVSAASWDYGYLPERIYEIYSSRWGVTPDHQQIKDDALLCSDGSSCQTISRVIE